MLLFLVACHERPIPEMPPEPPSPFAVADSLRRRGLNNLAVVHYRRLRDSHAVAGDSAGWWKAQLWWGYALMRLGRRDSAREALESALTLAGGDPRREALTRAITSNFLDLQGLFDSALGQATRARELSRVVQDRELESITYNALGRIYSLTGQYRKALAIHTVALARRRQLGDGKPGQLAQELNEIGIDYYHLGRFDEAAKTFDESLEIYRRIRDRDGMGRVSLNLGNVYSSAGNADRALELYTDALHSYEQGHNVRGMGLAHNNLGDLYQVAGNVHQARRHLEESLRINRSAGLAFGEILALTNLGEVLLDQDSLAAAGSTFAEALRIADSLGYHIQRADLRALLARTAARRGEARAARRFAGAARAIADSIAIPDAQFHALDAHAVALEAAGDAGAADAFVAAIDLLDSWRGRLALGDLRMGLGEWWLGTYEDAVRSLLAAGRVSDAFGVAERARGRLLLALMARRGGDSLPPSPEDSLRQQLQDRFAAWSEATGDERQPLDREIGEITRRLDQWREQAARRDPASAVRHAAPAGVARVQADLVRPGRGLLLFFWGDRDVYGWWVGTDEVRGARLGSADSIAAQLDFLRLGLEARTEGAAWRRAARRAYQLVIAPLAPAATPEVLVVPDGPLAHVPLEVLVPGDSGRPWGADARFIYGPSASVLLTLQRAPAPKRWDRAALVVGNPSAGSARGVEDSWREGSDALPPLPYAEQEAQVIRELFRPAGADLLVGSRATPARWLQLRPGRYRYLHFAAHARVNNQRPERTHLVLAQGNLDLAAIRNLRLRAELVTLSACETGLGRRVRGEGIIGLPHAFLSAGARGVLVTLWRIGDRSASDFMREFYAELHGGSPPAEALRQVRARWAASEGPRAHPSRWAPFVLVGAMNE